MGEPHHCALPDEQVATQLWTPPPTPALDHVAIRLVEDAVFQRRAQRLALEFLDDGELHLADDGSRIDWELDVSSVVDVVMSPAANGIRIVCLASADTLTSRTFDYDTVARRCLELAFLHPGVSIELYDGRTISEVEDEVVPDGCQPTASTRPLHRRRTLCYDDGVPGYVAWLNRTRFPLHPNVIQFSNALEGMTIDVALQWNSGYSESVYVFVNAVGVPLEDPYEEGFRCALLNVVHHHGHRRGLWVPALTHGDVLEGLAAVVAISTTEPPSGVGRSVAAVVGRACRRELTRWFAAHPDEGDRIVQKVCEAHDVRRASRVTSCRG
jgi:DNA gyrase subunit B